ncbi:MAG: hypothetical protein ACYTXE_37700 [Nostoc sp.]
MHTYNNLHIFNSLPRLQIISAVIRRGGVVGLTGNCVAERRRLRRVSCERSLTPNS